MNLFGKAFSHKNFIGVDIGTTSVKAVQLKPGKKPELRDYAILENFNLLEKLSESVQAGSLKTLDKNTTEFLKMATQQLDKQNSEVVASIQAFSAFTTLIELPLMSEQETASAMQFQAKQYILLPLEEITLDWVKVGEKIGPDGEKKQQLLLVSVPNEIINKYKNIFEAAGLNLTALEIEGLSLARSLTLNSPELALIIDIGSRSTSILLAQNGFLKFLTQTDFAGSSLTQNLASGSQIGILEAEELKRSAQQLSTLMLPVADVIINEARQVKDNFAKTYNERAAKVIVTGGGANLAGLERYIGEKLGLPASKGNAFYMLAYPKELEPAVPELNPILAIAIGLALRNAI
jgi:type IV pilus assembly protein PilM